jgi:hypothetical protein
MRLVESGPSVTNEDVRIEIAARTIAGLEKGEPWPSNADLGGGPTGTRDDEYRDAMREQAREVLEAVDAVTRPSSEVRARVLREAAARFDKLHKEGKDDPWYWTDAADYLNEWAEEETNGD